MDKFLAQGKFSEGYARVVSTQINIVNYREKLNYGFIDQSKQLVTPLEYNVPAGIDYMEFLDLTEYDFHNGKCLVFKEDKEGIIDKVNRVVIPFDNYRITLGNPIHSRDSYICSYVDKDILVSRAGKLTKSYENIYPLIEGSDLLIIVAETGGPKGLLNWFGEEVVKPSLLKITAIPKTNYFIYRDLEDCWGVGNLEDGAVVLPAIYNTIDYFSDRLVLALTDSEVKLKINELPQYSKKIISHVKHNEDFYINQYGRVPSIDKV